MDYTQFRVRPDETLSLKKRDPDFTGDFKDKSAAREKLEKDVEKLAALQEVLYADNRYALLIIFQAMDAAGKDGAIEHVMSGINPQGCQVFSFKAPSAEELDHDFLWRCMKALPERGRIGIFNRSYYEEVLIVRVHPEIVKSQKLPADTDWKNIWKDRFEDINHFERYLVRNGIVVVKFFLHISRKEQKERFLARIHTPEKNWKFSLADVEERKHWQKYMKAYEAAIAATSTKWAPWYVIPGDHKWFARVAIADILIHTLKSLPLKFPEVTAEHLKEIEVAKKMLEEEDE
ncbi:MAG: polyphosphate kinase 2 family protein [Acidobacteria bacterium]|nr:polyphosphate kinase 2 family protein [Acidobacteriota bacterium]